jgi:hypothetical protein
MTTPVLDALAMLSVSAVRVMARRMEQVVEVEELEKLLRDKLAAQFGTVEEAVGVVEDIDNALKDALKELL